MKIKQWETAFDWVRDKIYGGGECEMWTQQEISEALITVIDALDEEDIIELFEFDMEQDGYFLD